MGLRRRITRLTARRRAIEDQSGPDSLDRRNYDRAWRRFDRRAVAQTLMGATMLMPLGVQAEPAHASTRDARGEEPESRRSDSPLSGMSFHVRSNGHAKRELENHRAPDRELLAHLLAQPTGMWFDGVTADVAREADRLMDDAEQRGQVPVIVAHNIPNRDCSPFSIGEMGETDAYREWIRDLARGIGDREAIVVLEPDALALVSCLTHEGRSARFALLREAVSVLKARTDARVYLAGGHARWVDADEMAQRLHLAGIDRADGFALNVSNFVSTERNISYGEQLSRRLGGVHFVIDTSRNGGDVRPGEWCNPDGAALGETPTADTGHPLVDAFLWIKPPGESDGTCNGGPPAGAWFGDYALELARAA